MRILLATTAEAGHLHPMLPFARACVAAGHEVAVLAAKSFAPVVERTGLAFLPCDDVDPAVIAEIHAEIARNPETLLKVMITRVWGDLAARALLPGALDAIDTWKPDVILRDPVEFGSAVAADLRSVPHLRMLHGRAGALLAVADAAVEAVSRVRESVGLPTDPTGERLRTPCLTRLPDILDLPYTAHPAEIHRFREDDASGAVEPLPRWWVNERDPLVYITFGTVTGRDGSGRNRLRETVGAVASLPVRVLVSAGGNSGDEPWPALPPNVHVVDWLAPARVLREAAVVVHHGGMGTLVEVLTAGLPAVVVPHFGDQPDNAALVGSLGGGLRVGTDQHAPFDATEARDAVARLLAEPSFTDAARRVSTMIRALPPVTEAVDLFARLLDA